MPETTLQSFKHSLASPLTALLCSLDLLRKEKSLPPLSKFNSSPPLLTSTSLFSSLIDSQNQEWNLVDPSSPANEYLDIISASALEIKELFDFRNDPVQSVNQIFSLKKVVQEVVVATRRHYLVKIYSNVNHISGKIAFHGQQAKLRIAIQHLINNAIEAYSPEIAVRPIDVQVIFSVVII